MRTYPILSLWFGVMFPLMGLTHPACAESPAHPVEPSTWQPASSAAIQIPVAVSALSTLGRAHFGHGSAYGGELHLDQELRLGTITRWSTIFGGSVGRMEMREGSMWLYGGNLALKYDIDAHRDHGIEVGVSVDAERPLQHHEERQKEPIAFGPYAAYTWEFSHRFFAAAEGGVAFHPGATERRPQPWSTLGVGVNFLMF